MQAVILAGGKGTRLHPLTTNIPKPMVPFFDRPVMEHCIKLLAKHDIKDIIITVSYLAKDIMHYFGNGSRWGVKIRYSVETEPLGTAGGVKLIQPMINDTFVIVSGDAVTDVDLTAAIEMHRSASSVASLMLYEVEDPTQFGLVECDSDNRVTRFLEKPKTSEIFTNTVNTGIYILEPEVLSSIPYNEVHDFARNLFPRLLHNSEPMYGFKLPGYWCDVGNLLQYRNAHFDALHGRVKLDLPAIHVGEGIWVGEGVDIHPSVQLASPVFVGKGASIRRNATLGEHSIIGADSLVDEGAYVTRSVIGCRSFIGRETKITDCIIGSGYSVMESESIYDRTLVASMQSEERKVFAPVINTATNTLAGLAKGSTLNQETAA